MSDCESRNRLRAAARAADLRRGRGATRRQEATFFTGAWCSNLDGRRSDSPEQPCLLCHGAAFQVREELMAHIDDHGGLQRHRNAYLHMESLCSHVVTGSEASWLQHISQWFYALSAYLVLWSV